MKTAIRRREYFNMEYPGATPIRVTILSTGGVIFSRGIGGGVSLTRDQVTSLIEYLQPSTSAPIIPRPLYRDLSVSE